jgi:hypothetical protein
MKRITAGEFQIEAQQIIGAGNQTAGIHHRSLKSKTW